MSGTVLLALGLWLLLTSDFSWGNVFLGLFGAVLVSRISRYRFSVHQLVSLGLGVLRSLPLALWQTLLIVCSPHHIERVKRVPLKHPTDPWACFCQVFLITFTPKSLVISDEHEGHVLLHSVEQKEEP